jgi:hypothetical protein
MTDKRATVLKLTAAGLLFAAAAFLVVRHFEGGSDEALPSTDDTATPWYCLTCNKGIELTAAQYAEQTRYAVHPNDLAAGGDMPSQVAMAPCPHCQKWAVAARKCPQDGVIFDAHETGASKGVCPKCGWNPNES